MDAPISILIVDDEPKNLTVLESILDHPHYRLVRAESPEEALLALTVDEFALLILDVRMPTMSGFELAKMIKERKKTARIPIIFLTAYFNEDQHVLEGYDTGAVDYLHKPVNPAILRSKVAVFAELHRAQAEVVSMNQMLLMEVNARRQTEEQLTLLNQTLEQRVNDRTADLRETERHLRQMIDGLPTAVYTTDACGYVARFNPAATVLVGREPLPGLDRWCISSKQYFSDGAPMLNHQSPLAVALNEGRPEMSKEMIIERPDGDRIWVAVYATPLFDENQKCTGAINVLIDVSKMKRIEVELRESDRRKNEFLATLGHELRNPLSPIVMAISLLRDRAQERQELNELTDVADRHLKQMIRLVDELLDISRISRGKIQLKKSPCQLQELIRFSVESVQPQIIELKHTLTVNIPESNVMVYGDSSRLHQSLSNVLSNAAKFTPSGGNISLNVRLESECICIEVVDDGVGIPESDISQVFKLFTQLKSVNSSTHLGLGVGLALAKQLIELHGGWIAIDSEGTNKGTKVEIGLPYAKTISSFDSPESSASDEPNAGESRERDFSPRFVLVVDDMRAIQVLACRMLEGMGHRAQSAGDGETALAMIETHQPDVILSDILMPGMDGYELARRIRSKYGDSIYLVAITGFGTEDDRQRAIDHGFDYHIVKPPTAEALEAVFKSIGTRVVSDRG